MQEGTWPGCCGSVRGAGKSDEGLCDLAQPDNDSLDADFGATSTRSPLVLFESNSISEYLFMPFGTFRQVNSASSVSVRATAYWKIWLE